MRMAGGRTASPQWARSGIGFVDDLARHGDAPALIEGDRTVTHAELDRLVDVAAAELGSGRRLVLVPLTPQIERVLGYLGCLRAGHVALVCPDDPATIARLVERFDPDTIVGPDGPAHRRETPRHDLHPELAALSSTSGSTGSPKLVRLSHSNLHSNAAAIATALHLAPTDRAITSLPLHYCYGQSVLHSHLAVGGAVILTATSVVDDCFWAAVDRHQVTTLAGVPHSFELLERSTVALADHPSLRQMTQAGGRMRPDLVRSMATRAAAHDVDFRVMYGQTEATARIAITPPGIAIDRPTVVGRAIPGSDVRIDPVGGLDDPAAGELVVRGPGVMLGYATSPVDLACGREISELRTGDLARVDAHGIIEIVGRRADFVKLFGLRIDLGRVGDMLAAEDIDAHVDGDDDGLVLALAPGQDPGSVGGDLARRLGLPRKAVIAAELAELPRLANGKVDRARMRREVRLLASDRGIGGDDHDGAVAEVFASVLGVDRVRSDDTFVALGGDSLSYVEASVRLERLLGTLPDGWHHRTVADLDRARVAPTRWARVDSNVVLRAIAIVLILANHTGAFLIGGGAHVLLAGAGYNLARFQLASGAPWRSILRLALPSAAWIGAVAATTDDFDLAHALLLHGWIGGPGRWSYWFVEVLAQLLVVTALALSVPAVRRLERARPFALPAALTAGALLVRFDLVELGDHHRPFFRPHEVAWIFLLGWMAQRADGPARRALVSAIALVSIPGYFGSPTRDLVLLGGILAMTWITRVPVPRSVTPAVGALAGASLWIYLTHFQVHPLLSPERPWLAMGLSVGVGVTAWRLLDPALVRLGDRITHHGARAVRRASAALPRQRSVGRDTVGS